MTTKRCRSFVKWVGGKSKLVPILKEYIPTKYKRYFEPFVGSGALFFHVQPSTAYLSDTNPQLMNCYEVVKSKVESLISELKKHIHSKDYFYKIRNVDRDSSFANWNDVEQAGRFIYLNKTCFNGLHRVNSKGQFNVPFGQYTNPTIVDADNLRACSAILQQAHLNRNSFENILSIVNAGDFVYFDPPYVPLNASSCFVNYTSNGFGNTDQVKLAEVCSELDRMKVNFMLSNSYTSFVLNLYKSFNIKMIEAARAINSKGDCRSKVREVVVTNYAYEDCKKR